MHRRTNHQISFGASTTRVSERKFLRKADTPSFVGVSGVPRLTKIMAVFSLRTVYFWAKKMGSIRAHFASVRYIRPVLTLTLLVLRPVDQHHQLVHKLVRYLVVKSLTLDKKRPVVVFDHGIHQDDYEQCLLYHLHAE